MRFRNNDKWVDDGTFKEMRWCFEKNIKAYPIPLKENYKSPSGRRKPYVKIEINCDGKILIGKKKYTQEKELTTALQEIYAHYYARRFGNKLM
tara:strand:+ start:6178 stop:6456 length:279 start_codon:yes stop_codon:yes gene_type:complete